MTDVVDTATRSRMMSGIRGKNTKPEMLIRSRLHGAGFRFRIHDNKLPGKPDIVLKKYNAVIFVHGCFWHRHNCHIFKWPKTNSDFWKNKLNGNYRKDIITQNELANLNWRTCIVWECATKNSPKNISNVIDEIAEWLMGKENSLEVSG